MYLKKQHSLLRALRTFVTIAIACGSCQHGLDSQSGSWWNNLPEAIFQRIHKSIYAVVDKCGRPIGTAFVVKHRSDNYLVTARHVLRSYDLEQLRFRRQEINGTKAELVQEEIRDARYVVFDDIQDIAVLTGSNIEDLPALELLPETKQHIRVFAIGMGGAQDYFGMTLTEGIIANAHKLITQAEALRHLRHVQHTADLLPGNSGGPLLDNRGRVVGVNVLGGSQMGFQQFFASAPHALFAGTEKSGVVRINNNGMGRIKQVAVTKYGEEPVPQDILPNNLGRINGQSFMQFQLPEGRYTITMDTEEGRDVSKQIKVQSGKTATIDYAFSNSGFRVFNTSCDLVEHFVVMTSQYAAAFMEAQKAGDKTTMENIIKKTDILGNERLMPGQVWVEYYVPGNWFLGAYKIDFKRGGVAYDIPPHALKPEEVKDIYIR